MRYREHASIDEASHNALYRQALFHYKIKYRNVPAFIAHIKDLSLPDIGHVFANALILKRV
jgi:hypothetical protein